MSNRAAFAAATAHVLLLAGSKSGSGSLCRSCFRRFDASTAVLVAAARTSPPDDLRKAATGARRIVKLYGAVRHHGDPLDALRLASIDAIRESGLSWVLVSPSSAMDTTMLDLAEAIKSFGCLAGCAGDGRVELVAADDVARAAAVVLIWRGEHGANYELTGPEALSMQAGRKCPEVTKRGRPVATA